MNLSNAYKECPKLNVFSPEFVAPGFSISVNVFESSIVAEKYRKKNNNKKAIIIKQKKKMYFIEADW